MTSATLRSSCCEFLLVDFDVDLVFETAADFHRRDARRRLQALLEFVVGEAAQLLQLRFADIAVRRAALRSATGA